MLESEGRQKPVSRHTIKAATGQRHRSQLEAPKSELGPSHLSKKVNDAQRASEEPQVHNKDTDKGRMYTLYPINVKMLHTQEVEHTSPFLQDTLCLVSGKRCKAKLHSKGCSHLRPWLTPFMTSW